MLQVGDIVRAKRTGAIGIVEPALKVVFALDPHRATTYICGSEPERTFEVIGHVEESDDSHD